LASVFATTVIFAAIGIIVPAAIDTVTIGARWRVDLVNRIATRCLDLERRHAKEAILPHTAEFLPIRGDSSLLVTAALATTKVSAEWTVDSDQVGLFLEFLLYGRELESFVKRMVRSNVFRLALPTVSCKGMNRSAPESAALVDMFLRLGNRLLSDIYLECCRGCLTTAACTHQTTQKAHRITVTIVTRRLFVIV
jgi:hypothetical protein